jgi:NMD protein affecting ribosome stability and mRNA decay
MATKIVCIECGRPYIPSELVDGLCPRCIREMQLTEEDNEDEEPEPEQEGFLDEGVDL